MAVLKNLGRRLARINYVRRAIEDRANLDPFKARPSARLMIGVCLIGLSMLLGWPAMSLLGSLALVFQEPLLAAIGVPLTYALSWIVYGVGLWIAGPDALIYAGIFVRWLVRVSVERLQGKERPPGVIQS